ncbi:hypothetical protein AXF42_Ash021721 [Apostasia shenzhenica]|uniref:Uncharacterized protein n=1 Tax=Apostasia shenzhenica TaxID=1088818 RepID=A0A2H9ZYG0_9ASPA|nr:hypothetical protein AXF42_Ash021721 [Apostasia shenzhenica]
MNIMWRNWKSHMYRIFIEPAEGDARYIVPDEYKTMINQQEWNDFIKARSSDEFLVKSAAAKERAKAQKYFHTTLRKGYAGLEYEMV